MQNEDEGKQVWPGAGIWFDILNPELEDFHRIKKHVQGIEGTKGQIEWIERLLVELKPAADAELDIHGPSLYPPARRLYELALHFLNRLKTIPEPQAKREEEAKKDESKELWPGAGFWLDIENGEHRYTSPAISKVDHRLEEIGTTEERILWLERLMIEFKDQEWNARERFRGDLWRQAAYEAGAFLRQIESRIEKLNEIRRLEVKEENQRAYRLWVVKREEQERLRLAALAREPEKGAADPAQTVGAADDPEPGKLNNLPAAVALYALLQAAGLPPNHNKSAVARFAHLLTGRSAKKMEGAFRNAAAGAFGDDIAAEVADLLGEIGLTELAACVRKRFMENSEI